MEEEGEEQENGKEDGREGGQQRVEGSVAESIKKRTSNTSSEASRRTIKELGNIVLYELGEPFRGFSGTCMNPWHTGCLADYKPREFETRVSCTGGRLSTCDAHVLDGAQCGEQRRPD